MIDFTFEENPWEAVLDTVQPGTSLPAARFLALLEGEDEAALEDAFQILEEKRITLDITQLPPIPVTGQTAVRLRQEQQLLENGNLMEGLEKNDPLRLYLEELAGIPVAGDVNLLAERCAEGDEDAARKLVELSLSRVVELAKDQAGKGVLLLDLIQEASLGLWQGVLRYTGGDFENHRDWWISQYLARAVVEQARSSGLGQKLRQGVQDYRDVDHRLLTELGRNPTREEIALELHIPAEDAAVFEGMLASAKSRKQAEDALEAGEENGEEEMAVEDTAYFRSRQRILELLSVLSEQEAKLLTLRFGLEGGLPLSPEDTGRKLGMTAQEVVTMEAEALAKLRQSEQG